MKYIIGKYQLNDFAKSTVDLEAFFVGRICRETAYNQGNRMV